MDQDVKGMSIYRDGVLSPYDIRAAIPDGPRNTTMGIGPNVHPVDI